GAVRSLLPSLVPVFTHGLSHPAIMSCPSSRRLLRSRAPRLLARLPARRWGAARRWEASDGRNRTAAAVARGIIGRSSPSRRILSVVGWPRWGHADSFHSVALGARSQGYRLNVGKHRLCWRVDVHPRTRAGG